MIFESQRDKNIYYSLKDNVCSTHFHKSAEIIYVISGEKKVKIGGKDLVLRERELAVVPPCVMHTFMPSLGGVQIVLSILPSYCEQFAKTCERADLSNFVYFDERCELLPLLKEAEGNKSEFFMLGVANLVFSRLCASVRFLPKEKSNEKNKIVEIYEYIEKNYTDDISLEKISAYFGYSKNHFSVLFKRNFNIGFNAYLNNTRVVKSVKYLKNHSIYEVSIMCGFKSPQQYHLNFKKVYGCSPKKYFE